MTSLADALDLALDHWSGRPGEGPMTTRARKAVEILGADRKAEALKAADGIKLLKALRDAGLSEKYARDCYIDFKRVLNLSNIDTKGWPTAPKPPRKPRDRLPPGAPKALEDWLRANGETPTADLVVLLRATGMRVKVEGLKTGSHGAVTYHTDKATGLEYAEVPIVGKGGHLRTVPVVDADAVALLRDPQRLAAVRAFGYEWHLRRFHKAVKALGITSRLATPHALRHTYGSDVAERGGLVMAQELLGHSSVTTTATYVHPSRERQLDALRGTTG